MRLSNIAYVSIMVFFVGLLLTTKGSAKSLCLTSQLNTQNQQEINAEKNFLNLTAGQDYVLSFEVTGITPSVNSIIDDGNSTQTISLVQPGNYSFNLTAAGTSIVFSLQSLSGKKQPTAICIDNLLLQAVSQQITTTIYKEPANNYRYAFNGMEKDDEVNGLGNSYTATFWQYDPRLGRRWNLDPKPNLSISSYAAFANNPVFYADPKGDTIRGSAAAMKKYGEFRTEIVNDIISVGESICNQEKLLSEASSEKKEVAIKRNLRTLNTKLGALADASAELDQLENSEQMYVLNLLDKPSDAKGGFIKYRPRTRVGDKTYDDVIQVNVNMGHSNPFAKMAHEFKHAFQYDNLQLSFDHSGNADFDYFNIADEIEAYQRQFFFETLYNQDKSPVLSHRLIDGEWVLNRSSVYEKLRGTSSVQSSISKGTLERMKAHNQQTFQQQKAAFDGTTWMSASGTVYYKGWRQAAGLK